MDITEKYIDMRIKAIPFLGRGQAPIVESILHCTCKDYFINVDSLGNFHIFEKDNRHICQLEKQDQLQKMIDLPFIEKRDDCLLQEFVSFVFDWHYEEWKSEAEKFDSFEQIWLAIVMEKNHNKSWIEWNNKNIWD